MVDLINSIDYSPLYISIKTGIVATGIAFFLGIFAARLVMNAGKRLKMIIDTILTLPLVLPPTVAGFFLLILFSLRRPFGKFLYLNFDIKIVQTWAGCVIAAGVIAFPLMYRNARAAFEQVDVNLIHAARTLGLTEFKIFWKLILPLSRPGIISGTVLTFARAIGEYGATSMLAGNILGKTRTMSVAIASEVAGGNYSVAGFWVILLVILSFLIIYLIHAFSGGDSKSNQKWE
ncbi:MAG: molybdate ABC transporter permease subunit [Mobilitalea sp.]